MDHGFIGIGLGGVKVFCVVEDVFVEVFDERFFFGFWELVPDGDVQGPCDLHHHFEGEPAAVFGALDLFVGELFGRGPDEAGAGDLPAFHECGQGLGAMIFLFHFHWCTGCVGVSGGMSKECVELLRVALVGTETILE